MQSVTVNILYLLCRYLLGEPAFGQILTLSDYPSFWYVSFEFYISDGSVCRCGPLGGSDGRALSHKDEWQRHGNTSGFTLQHNGFFIGW